MHDLQYILGFRAISGLVLIVVLASVLIALRC
jgi:hypothetical protein